MKRLRSGQTDIYDSSDRMVKYLQEKDLAPQTVHLHRGLLPVLFEFLSPKLDFDRREFDRAVRKVEAYKVTEDRVPTKDETRRVLIHAPSHKIKAFIAISCCTGRRLREITSLKFKDIDFTKKPIRVYFRAKTTKTKNEAFAFLSPETAEIVQTYLKHRGFESQWLFPGISKEKHPLDKPMAKSNAWQMVMQAFKTAEMDQKDDRGRNVYHPHVWRNFALNHMRSSGLNETMAKQVVGHNTGVEEHYKDWEEIARSWQEKCEQEFTFLSDTRILEKVKVETEMAKAQSELLKEQFAELREAVQIYRTRGREAVDWAVEKLKQPNPKPVDLLTESPIGLALEAEENVTKKAKELALASSKTQKFSNHIYDYIKTGIETREFDEALIDGYEKYMDDPKTGLIVLRKSKTAPLS